MGMKLWVLGLTIMLALPKFVVIRELEVVGAIIAFIGAILYLLNI